jgi:hypothetical protein
MIHNDISMVHSTSYRNERSLESFSSMRRPVERLPHECTQFQKAASTAALHRSQYSSPCDFKIRHSLLRICQGVRNATSAGMEMLPIADDVSFGFTRSPFDHPVIIHPRL